MDVLRGGNHDAAAAAAVSSSKEVVSEGPGWLVLSAVVCAPSPQGIMSYVVLVVSTNALVLLQYSVLLRSNAPSGERERSASERLSPTPQRVGAARRAQSSLAL